MKLEEFFEDTAPYYQSMLENKGLSEKASEYLKGCFCRFYVENASEDDLDAFIKRALEQTFIDWDIEARMNDYLEHHDVSDKVDGLNVLIKLLEELI